MGFSDPFFSILIPLVFTCQKKRIPDLPTCNLSIQWWIFHLWLRPTTSIYWPTQKPCFLRPSPPAGCSLQKLLLTKSKVWMRNLGKRDFDILKHQWILSYQHGHGTEGCPGLSQQWQTQREMNPDHFNTHNAKVITAA